MDAVVLKEIDLLSLWNKALQLSKEAFEEEYGEPWDEADKYSREDYAMKEYKKLVSKNIMDL